MWEDKDGQKLEKVFDTKNVNKDWGKQHKRSYLMGEAIVETDWKCSELC